MIELTLFITQSLSPAFAISASGILASSMNSRIAILGSRVRELDREIQIATDPLRLCNLKLQVGYFIRRARLLRNALVCLYAAIVMMVLTAFGLAMHGLHVTIFNLSLWGLSGMAPIVTFLTGLTFILIGVVLGATEVSLLLKALKLDVNHAFGTLEKRMQQPDSPGL